MTSKDIVKSQELGITKYQLFCVIAASLSSLNCGWNLAVTNIPGTIITQCLGTSQNSTSGLPPCIPTTEFMWGIAVGSYALGALCGALSCTWFSNRYGRRWVLLYSNGIGIAASLVLALSVNVAMVAVGRVIAGVAQGAANGTFTTYVVEITTSRARSSLANMTQMAVSTGMLVAFALSLSMLEPPLWRVLFAITGLLCIISGAAMSMCVESPRWLAMNGHADHARDALVRLRRGADVTEELELMQGPAANDAVMDESESKQGPAPEETIRAASVVDLVLGRTADNLYHQVFLAIGLMFFQQASGISAIGFFSTTLFGAISAAKDTANISTPTAPQVLSVVLMGVGTAATLGGMLLANHWGRRTLMLAAHGAMSIFCVLISVGSVVPGLSRLAIAGVFLYFIVFFVGPGPLPWVVPNELTPTYATAALMAINNSVCYIGIFIVGLGFAPLMGLAGGYTFLVFAVGNALAFQPTTILSAVLTAFTAFLLATVASPDNNSAGLALPGPGDTALGAANKLASPAPLVGPLLGALGLGSSSK
ncbi:Bifunctional purine biosynthesis protein PurH [Coemansia sp. RSA 1933]|nr:Bifunctional purine biosynthesis protein PurH [Coemansia sp. RSA 1933]